MVKDIEWEQTFQRKAQAVSTKNKKNFKKALQPCVTGDPLQGFLLIGA